MGRSDDVKTNFLPPRGQPIAVLRIPRCNFLRIWLFERSIFEIVQSYIAIYSKYKENNSFPNKARYSIDSDTVMYTANYQPLRFLYDCKFLFVVRLKVNKRFPLVLSHLLESVFFEIPILIRFIGALRLLRDRRFPRHSQECKEKFSPSATVLLSSIGVHRDCHRNSLLRWLPMCTLQPWNSTS